MLYTAFNEKQCVVIFNAFFQVNDTPSIFICFRVRQDYQTKATMLLNYVRKCYKWQRKYYALRKF